jgi:sortase A
MTVRVLLREEEELDSRGRRLRWAEYFFLFIGLIALDYYIWVSLDATFYQAYESWSFDQQMKGGPVSFPRYVEDEVGVLWSRIYADFMAGAKAPHESRPTEATTAKPTKPLAPGQPKPKPLSVIGRIEVPRLSLTAMVREGVEEDTLRRAVGHIPSTALPGQMGNVALAGHRDTFFRKLRDIRNSDKILLSTLHGDYDYQVQSVKIVMPTDLGVLEPSPGEQSLTLVTCYPFNYIGSAPKRFIVRARLIEPNPPQPTGF